MNASAYASAHTSPAVHLLTCLPYCLTPYYLIESLIKFLVPEIVILRDIGLFVDLGLSIKNIVSKNRKDMRIG